ncbi:MAG TPA: tRNA dihydrouridine synthase DusB [Spirochaetota bacterium]|nr:tRNA dihydrouridine synthase DusB [Spirochaetota bacterium]
MESSTNSTVLAGVKLCSPIILAPLAGYTDLPFRQIARKHGAGFVFTELVSVEGIVRKNPKTIDLLKISDEERPVGIQLFGRSPEVMAEASSIVETLHPDCIDINFGCCAQKVCSGDAGAALLKKPETLFKIASGIVSAVKIPVSAKIRIGWDDSSKNYREIVSLLTDAGISFISVHGRTRAQKYTGRADWDVIAEIAEISKVPVIGNGDIMSYNEAMKRLSETKCSAVMIGRAAIGNPWIFTGHTPTIDERFDCALDHVNAMISYYGEYGVILARKHLVNYFHHFTNAGHIRNRIVTAQNSVEIRAALEECRKIFTPVTDVP